MRKKLLIAFLIISSIGRAQKIDSIFVDLYTDSLKKGTYNYINIVGRLSNGRYLPLDSTDIQFTSSAGRFFGNSLWVEPDFNEDKIHITATLKRDPAFRNEFDMYIKKKPDDEHLKTTEEIMNELKKKKN
ncbi:hypothetical protein [Ferruginibacter albus]|uniref:hypothetical protein n=1 Tax=Ferruginibacter albus TaxID=2875540 RepID=UPI001CC650F3|nr:hypothetical protein [Ferruginibacter albus]UAY50795.1 hypothetical protein K9M53_09345 [Ferruginibacter albus]